MNYIVVLCLISLATFASAKKCCPHCLGCPSQLEGESLKRAEEDLINALATLAAGDGPYYTLVKVNSVTHYPVSGWLNKYDADLKNKDGTVKKCQIEMFSKHWERNYTTVEFECEGEETIKTSFINDKKE